MKAGLLAALAALIVLVFLPERALADPAPDAHEPPDLAPAPIISAQAERQMQADDDQDSVRNLDDVCPGAHEDRDGFKDGDGCPDPDNDQDGILDVRDRCPDVTEDFDAFADDDGCPDPDNDNDDVCDPIIAERQDASTFSCQGVDACVSEPEDRDGFEDADGCPEPDNDQDSLADLEDQCPNTAEDRDGFEDADGCPELDNDQDGLADLVDECPDEPEDFDRMEDHDGCYEEFGALSIEIFGYRPSGPFWYLGMSGDVAITSELGHGQHLQSLLRTGVITSWLHAEAGLGGAWVRDPDNNDSGALITRLRAGLPLLTWPVRGEFLGGFSPIHLYLGLEAWLGWMPPDSHQQWLLRSLGFYVGNEIFITRDFSLTLDIVFPISAAPYERPLQLGAGFTVPLERTNEEGAGSAPERVLDSFDLLGLAGHRDHTRISGYVLAAIESWRSDSFSAAQPIAFSTGYFISFADWPFELGIKNTLAVWEEPGLAVDYSFTGYTGITTGLLGGGSMLMGALYAPTAYDGHTIMPYLLTPLIATASGLPLTVSVGVDVLSAPSRYAFPDDFSPVNLSVGAFMMAGALSRDQRLVDGQELDAETAAQYDSLAALQADFDEVKLEHQISFIGQLGLYVANKIYFNESYGLRLEYQHALAAKNFGFHMFSLSIFTEGRQ